MSDHYKPNYVNENAEELNEEYSNDDLFNITSWGADLSFRELITMYEEGELLKPELQRKYVWSKDEASRFIESLLLGLPVPSIFLSETSNEEKLIIDGFQRIMTVYDYVKGIFSKDEKVFKLTNSKKINERWRGKAFSELSDADQRKIKKSTIHAIIFVQNSPKDNDTSLFQIFERINTGGRTLTAQEIRNCVYQGDLNDLLFELNKQAAWRYLLGKEDEDPRMLDLEFILRFFALQSEIIKTTIRNQISLKQHLNTFMGNKAEHNLSEFKVSFENNINFLYDTIGASAFQNWSQESNEFSGRFSPTIFDSIMIATEYARKNQFNFKQCVTTNFQQKHKELLCDEKFLEYSTERTTNVEHIKGRITIATSILYGLSYE